MVKFKLTVASLLVLSSSLVFANPAPSPDAWELNASALYLHPSFGGNGLGYSAFGNYAGADNQQVITTHNNVNYIYNINPKESWGFQVGAAYHYFETNDVRLDWYHLSEGVSGNFPHGTLFSASIDGYYAGALQLTTQWNAANFELGHSIWLRPNEVLRLHGGLQYARIKNRFTNHPMLFLDAAPYFTSSDTLSYAGLGPRMGADFDYGVGYGFGVFVKGAGSLLLGKARQVVHGYIDAGNTIYGVIPYGVNNYASSQWNVIVPEVEAKLGVNYERPMINGTFDVDLGYMWMTYIRSIVAYTGMGVIGSSIGFPTMTHFDLSGVYLNASWKGNI